MAWGQRARQAARRARRLARTAAVRTQRAAGEVADQFRRLGRRAAGHDIRLMRMARLPEQMVRQAAASVLHRERGPLPDPAWVAGYRDVVTAEGVLPRSVPGRVMPRTEAVPSQEADVPDLPAAPEREAEAASADAHPDAGPAAGPVLADPETGEDYEVDSADLEPEAGQ